MLSDLVPFELSASPPGVELFAPPVDRRRARARKCSSEVGWAAVGQAPMV